MSPLRLPFKAAKAVWYKSWTKLLGYAQMSGSALLFGLSEINSIVSDETFKSYLSALDVPKGILIGIAILGLVTWLAHGRRDA